MTFQPDYRIIQQAAWNRRPHRLAFYEHNIAAAPAQAIDGGNWAALQGSTDPKDLDEYFRNLCRFCASVGYDTVSFECCLGGVMEGGALGQHKPGVIFDDASYMAYPWAVRAEQYWALNRPRFDALARSLPAGMKVVGGVGNGVFETVQDLVGYEKLVYMQVDNPELFEKLIVRVGDLLVEIWTEFLKRYKDAFCVCRFGDDLGFKTGPLLSSESIRRYIIPQYKRVIALVHEAGLPFILHSCGCIFEVMDDLIEAGIDAKHSNEDAICDFTRWVDNYNDRIGLFGGIDMDIIVRETPDEVYRVTKELATELRAKTQGFAFGTGNQIHHQIPPANFSEMLRALREVRAAEKS